MLRGIAQCSHTYGPFSFYPEPSGREVTLYSKIQDWEVDGIIARDEKLDDKILKMNLPLVVYISRQDPALYEYKIIADNRAIGRMAADHFIERKFKNFGFCGYSDVFYSKLRYEHFKQKISESGFDVNLYDNSERIASISWEKELKDICGWLKNLPKPVAIFACVDERARHVSEACRRIGLEIPNEVAVLGVDDDDIICELAEPPLSSIALNPMQSGYMATKMLIDLIDNKVVENKEIIVRPIGVRTRQSSDIMAIKDTQIVNTIDYIKKNCTKPIQVEDIVQAVSVSRRTLERKFVDVLGKTLYQQIKECKTEKIAYLLLETNFSIKRIAFIMNFDDPSNLSRYFKQVRGISCKEFRERYGEIHLETQNKDT